MPGFLCDLHIHSCLSPCGDEEMTPYNLVNMAKVMGLDILALTDHNSSLNCPAAARAAEEAGIAFVPGMELTTSEEVHVVCLFPDVDSALAFSGYVAERLPKIKNRLDIFGEQLIMDDRDGILGREENLLSTASFISIGEVFPARLRLRRGLLSRSVLTARRSAWLQTSARSTKAGDSQTPRCPLSLRRTGSLKSIRCSEK